jgi:hypothetical protein
MNHAEIAISAAETIRKTQAAAKAQAQYLLTH